MLDDIEIIDHPQTPSAVLAIVVHHDDLPTAMDAGIRELFEVLQAQGVTPVGPLYSYHRRMPTETFDLEIGIPVPHAIAPAHRVTNGELRACRAARTVYHGTYDGLGDAWGQFMGQLRARDDLTLAGDFWETYLSGPEDAEDPERCTTALVTPLAD